MAPSLLKELLDYAVEQLANGRGSDALTHFGITDPEFVQLYSIGYLPSDFKQALGSEQRKKVKGLSFANTLVLPAFDTAGTVVDLLAVRAQSTGRTYESIDGLPHGILAPSLLKAFDNLFITDSFATAARLFHSGVKNTLLIRGLRDICSNAEQIRTSGIKSVTVIARRDSGRIQTLLKEVGVTAYKESYAKELTTSQLPRCEWTPSDVLPSTIRQQLGDEFKPKDEFHVPEVATLENFDIKKGRAIFVAGPVRYHIDLGYTHSADVQLSIEYNGRSHQDRFNLTVDAQRQRFASAASAALRILAPVLQAHLCSFPHELEPLWKAWHGRPDPCSAAAANEATIRALCKSDLIDTIATDLEILGWVGDRREKVLLYLVALSRKLRRPLSAALIAASEFDSHAGLEIIAAITPQEDLVRLSRLTDSALYYQQPEALCHKLLILDSAARITPEVQTALRILQTRGALSQSHVLRDPTTGVATSHFIEARGPVSIITSSDATLHGRTLTRCIDIPLDESLEQTERVLRAQRELYNSDYAELDERRGAILKKHLEWQRALQCRSVTIPFAAQMSFPASSIQCRRHQELLLGLIETIALLNQYNRKIRRSASGEEFIAAEIPDYEAAVTLMGDLLLVDNELSAHAAEFIALLRKAGLSEFSMDDLKALRPEWTRYRFRAVIQELMKIDVLVSPHGGRGKVRKYQIGSCSEMALSAPAVRLLTAHELRQKLEVGDNAFANFNLNTGTC